MLTPTGPDFPVQRKSAIGRLRERWRVYRERKARLNASRYVGGGEARDRLPPVGGGF